jgi:hypothetical protein
VLSVRRAASLLTAGTLGLSTVVVGSLGMAQAAPSGFTFTSAVDTSIVVPAGTCAIQWAVIGARGGADSGATAASAPTERRITTTVTEGQTFTLAAGAAGASFADGSAGGTNPAGSGAYDGQAGNAGAGGGGGGGAASVVLEGGSVYLSADGSAGAGSDGGAAGTSTVPLTGDVTATDVDGATSNPGPSGLITGTGVACDDAGAGVATLDPPWGPSFLGVTAGDRQLTISFVADSDGNAALPDRWEYSLDGGAWTVVEPDHTFDGLEFTLTGLTNGRSYTVGVRAVSDVSGPSPAGDVTAAPYTMNAPRRLAATAGPATLDITWSAPAAGGTFPIAGYMVTGIRGPGRFPSGELLCTTDAATRSCSVKARPGLRYVVTVWAVDSVGNYGPTAEVTSGVVPLPLRVPASDEPLGGVTAGETLQAGQTVTLRGGGFQRNSPIQAAIYSTPTPLGTFETDGNGKFEIEVTIPTGMAAGEHSLIVSGFTPRGRQRVLRTDVIVVASGTVTPGPGAELAYTGAPVVGPAIGGLAAVVVGSGLLLVSRRRKNA